MTQSEFISNVDKLIAQTREGNVDANIAMRVFSDAYSAIPRGGYIQDLEESKIYHDGSSTYHEIKPDQSANLRGQHYAKEQGFGVCNDKPLAVDMDMCMTKVYGRPAFELKKVTFENGLKEDQRIQRYSFLGLKVENSNTVWAKELDHGIKLERKEGNNRFDLTISKKLDDGSTQHLTFFRSSTGLFAPAMYSGMRVTAPDGQVTERKTIRRVIGEHGY